MLTPPSSPVCWGLSFPILAGAAAALAVVALWGAGGEGVRAQGLIITVNTVIDGPDLAPGDGVCDAMPLAGTQCSLRAAIQESNAGPQANAIIFNIPGPGPHVVDIATDLPEILGSATAIDGSGENACGPPQADWCVQLVFTTNRVSAGLAVDAPSVTIRNLSLEGQSVAAPLEGGVVLRAGADQALVEHLLVTGFVGSGIFQVAGAGGSGMVIRGNVLQANGEGIRIVEGQDNLIQSNTVAGNQSGGVIAVDQVGLTLSDNVLGGNGSLQLGLEGSLTDGALAVRNFIDTASDGIVVEDAGVGADIDIGGSEGAANIFRGPLAQAGGPDPGDDWYLQNSSQAAIDARLNDWNFYNRFEIEEVICASNASHGCGAGRVQFEPFIGSPLPTPVPTGTGVPQGTGTPTPTLTPTETSTPAGPEVVVLTEGCNLRAFQPFYPPGTPLSDISDDIRDIGVRLWFQVPGSPIFDLFDPFSPERSTKEVLGPQDEGGFVCVDFSTLWERPRA